MVVAPFVSCGQPMTSNVVVVWCFTSSAQHIQGIPMNSLLLGVSNSNSSKSNLEFNLSEVVLEMQGSPNHKDVVIRGDEDDDLFINCLLLIFLFN